VYKHTKLDGDRSNRC